MGKQLKQQNKKGKQQLQQQQDKKGSPPPPTPPPTPSPEVCGACCAPRQAAVLGPLVGSSECAQTAFVVPEDRSELPGGDGLRRS